MNFTIIIIFLAVFAIGTPLYMKFVVPKMMKKMDGRKAEAEQDFANRGEEIMDEFLSNPDKFGLLQQSLQGQKLYGISNGKLHEGVKISDKLKEHIISRITLTREVDMNLGYLAAAEDGLHYMLFDGERCIINDVFDYAEIANQKFTKTIYTFDYKGEQLKFYVSEALIFYPRFNVHEVEASGSGQGRIRTVNSFVREWLAWEPTNNVEYKSRVLFKPGGGVDLIQKKEFFLDEIIRTRLFNGFLKKMEITIE